MSRNYTHYWANDTCTYYQEIGIDGKLLQHIAGNQFRAKDVRRGDFIFVVTVRKGNLYLIGKLKAAQVVDPETAAEITGSEELWDAEDHILASDATPMKFTRIVPINITKKLRFISGRTRKSPVFTEDGVLDRQTLRGVRQLADSSATELDKLLPPMQKVVW